MRGRTIDPRLRDVKYERISLHRSVCQQAREMAIEAKVPLSTVVALAVTHYYKHMHTEPQSGADRLDIRIPPLV